MFKIVRNISLMVFCAGLLAGCSTSTREALGIKKQAPDEFKVVSNPPLSLPPQFSLRPPVRKIEVKEITSINGKEGRVVFEKTSADISTESMYTTKGENSFLSKAGASNANPNIKEILEKEANAPKEKKGMLNKIAFFSSKKESAEQDPIVDAMQEKERIMKNKSEGKAINDGETAVLEEKDGLLNNVFGF